MRHRRFSVVVMLLFLMVLLPLPSLAQMTITGTVSDGGNGEPIFGALVKVKGTGTGTTTDLDGFFTLKAEPGQTLEFSYVGYATLTAKVPAGGNMNIRMSEDQQALNDVVVVGYGMMKRSDLTGAVSSIGEEQIREGVSTTLEQAMQGRIAGVNVTQNSGAPGGGISVQIRGINSFNGNEPLYVIDGIALSGNNANGSSSVLASIAPGDITSIEVLKDASATAIYGSRASNGVVIITTKKGEEGKTKISYEGYFGWQSMAKKLDMLNLRQYAELDNAKSDIRGYDWRPEFTNPEVLGNGTDWQDELFRSAFMHNHALNISGGTKSTHYSVSGGYLSQDGISLGSSFDRMSLRSNFDTQVNNWMQLGANIYYANTKQNNAFSSGTAIQTALDQSPDIPVRDLDGEYAFISTNRAGENYSNPVYEALMRQNKDNNYNADYSVFANFTPIKGLSVRFEYGGSRNWNNNYYFQPEYTYGSVTNISNSQRTKTVNKYTTFKQYATYDTDLFKKTSHLQVMLGHEAQWGAYESLYGERSNYVTNTIKSLNFGDATTSVTQGSDPVRWAIESYYGRINYTLKDRYLLTATLRSDGSSNFSKKERWGVFPSAALAWRISGENFMKNVKWVDNLKLRLGWGLVGNQNASNYAFLSQLAAATSAWGTGYLPSNIANENLKWESTHSYNLGLDMNLFGNRLEVIMDFYLKNTKDLLMQSSEPSYITNQFSFTAPWENTGEIRNKGFELTVNSVNVMRKNWQWRTNATLSVNRNKVIKLNNDQGSLYGQYTLSGSGTPSIFTRSEVGGPVGRFYGWKVKGMFNTMDDFYQKDANGEFILDQNGNRVEVARPVNNGSVLPIDKDNGVWVGDYIFEDVNGDGQISEADRTYIGDPNPDFTFGLSNSLTWKNIELTVFFNGAVGGDIYNITRQEHMQTSGYSYKNKMSDIFSYARIGTDADGNAYVMNPGTSVPRLSQSNLNQNNRISNMFVEDGSYLRLKTLTIGWNIPKQWLKPVGIDWLQVYASFQNLFTITGYDGYDPEVGSYGQNVLMQGLDIYRYPSPRIYTFGMKLNF